MLAVIIYTVDSGAVLKGVKGGGVRFQGPLTDNNITVKYCLETLLAVGNSPAIKQ